MANLLDSPALPARGLPSQATTQPALARGHTVRRMLWWLALLCVLPGATVGASLIWMEAQRRQADAEQTALTAARAMALAENAAGMLVVGSSLMAYSAFRLCRVIADRGKPLIAINLGKTRADDLLDLKIEASCEQLLPLLVEVLDR